MSTGWNSDRVVSWNTTIINLLGNEYWLELIWLYPLPHKSIEATCDTQNSNALML